jgi:hypothetical protein
VWTGDARDTRPTADFPIDHCRCADSRGRRTRNLRRRPHAHRPRINGLVVPSKSGRRGRPRGPYLKSPWHQSVASSF